MEFSEKPCVFLSLFYDYLTTIEYKVICREMGEKNHYHLRSSKLTDISHMFALKTGIKFKLLKIFKKKKKPREKVMKKMITILLICVLFVFVSPLSFGDLNVKTGVTLTGKTKGLNLLMSGINSKESFDLNTGFALGVEYLVPLIDFVKVGGGVQYYLPKEFKDKKIIPADLIYSWVPIYFTVKVNPFVALLNGIFVKANIGYNFFNGNAQTAVVSGRELKTEYSGGTYYSFGAGYEFLFIILEVLFNLDKSQISLLSKSGENHNNDISSYGIAVNIGCKIPI
jgi:hypothetical protein